MYALCLSKTGLPPRLERQRQRHESRGDEEGTADIDGHRRLQVAKHGDDRGHDAKDAVRRGRERVARAPILGGEQLGRETVQHRVHDVAAEVERAVPPEQAR